MGLMLGNDKSQIALLNNICSHFLYLYVLAFDCAYSIAPQYQLQGFGACAYYQCDLM